MAEAASLAASGYFLFFLAAALSKLDGWVAWKESVRRLFRSTWQQGLARVLVPSAELATAALLIGHPRLGLLLSALLLASFAVGVVKLRSQHEGHQCKCFGNVISSNISLRLAIVDASLAATALVLAAYIGTSAQGFHPLSLYLTVLLGIGTLSGLEFARFRARYLPFAYGHPDE